MDSIRSSRLRWQGPFLVRPPHDWSGANRAMPPRYICRSAAFSSFQPHLPECRETNASSQTPKEVPERAEVWGANPGIILRQSVHVLFKVDKLPWMREQRDDFRRIFQNPSESVLHSIRIKQSRTQRCALSTCIYCKGNLNNGQIPSLGRVAAGWSIRCQGCAAVIVYRQKTPTACYPLRHDRRVHDIPLA